MTFYPTSTPPGVIRNTDLRTFWDAAIAAWSSSRVIPWSLDDDGPYSRSRGVCTSLAPHQEKILKITDTLMSIRTTKLKVEFNQELCIQLRDASALSKLNSWRLPKLIKMSSFSAVSTRIFASKYSLESSRRDLHNALLCTAL